MSAPWLIPHEQNHQNRRLGGTGACDGSAGCCTNDRFKGLLRAGAQQPDAGRETWPIQRRDLPARGRPRHEGADAGGRQDAGHSAARKPGRRSERSAEIGTLYLRRRVVEKGTTCALDYRAFAGRSSVEGPEPLEHVVFDNTIHASWPDLFRPSTPLFVAPLRLWMPATSADMTIPSKYITP
jgi:hypothetical protein